MPPSLWSSLIAAWRDYDNEFGIIPHRMHYWYGKDVNHTPSATTLDGPAEGRLTLRNQQPFFLFPPVTFFFFFFKGYVLYFQ